MQGVLWHDMSDEVGEDPDFAPSVAFGQALAGARRRRGLNVREAAGVAGISEGRWRQLELGYQQVAAGVRIPARPKASTVRAVAAAVGLNLREAFERLGMTVPDDVLAASQVEVDRPSVTGAEEGREPYLSRRDPDYDSMPLDELQHHVNAALEALAKRARGNNPDAER